MKDEMWERAADLGRFLAPVAFVLLVILALVYFMAARFNLERLDECRAANEELRKMVKP